MPSGAKKHPACLGQRVYRPAHGKPRFPAISRREDLAKRAILFKAVHTRHICRFLIAVRPYLSCACCGSDRRSIPKIVWKGRGSAAVITVKNLCKTFGTSRGLARHKRDHRARRKGCYCRSLGQREKHFSALFEPLLEPPTSGEIWFEGTQINSPDCDINLVRRKMGMVFQHFHLFPHLTILENITLRAHKA